MKLLLLSGALLLLGFHGKSQYCITGGPSSLADSNLEGLSITGASGSINYIGCPAVAGVEYYTNETTTLNAGASYTINIQFGTCGGNFSSVGEVWIDFNGNGIFESSESVFTWSGMPMTTPQAYLITVPANALSGVQRMRVMQAEQATLPLDPCASFTWGSVTDFNVTITGGVDCSGYIGDDRFDPRIVNGFPYSETHNSAICYSNQNPTYNSSDVFYRIVPNGVSSLKVSLCGSNFDTFLSIIDQNGMAIYGNDDSGACGTASEISFPTDGYDTLFAVVEGWGIASGDYTITITEEALNIQESAFEPLGLFPNPAHNLIHFGAAQSGKLNFFSTQGQLIHEQSLNNESEVNVSHLPRGMYIVTLTNETAVSQQKVVLK